MSDFVCGDCDKQFSTEKQLSKHNKKKKCKIIEEKEIIPVPISEPDSDEPSVSDSELKLKNETKYNMIDLFAGTGAFSHVFESLQYAKCVYANDMAKTSEQIFKLNHPSARFELADLNNVDVSKIPPHDILCGGFPCQPFSIAGKREGFKDKRSNVFNKIIEILKHHQPKIAILENVKNLKTHDDGNTFKIVIDKLTEAGYYVKTSILDTSKLSNIPHHRERIYIVCFRNRDMFEKFNFDFKTIKLSPIKTFLEENILSKYYYTKKLKVYEKIKSEITNHIDTNVLYQFRRHYIRENKNNCCPTLTANMGTGGHNVPLLLDNQGIRKLTPRECFNLQGFPSSYQLPEISDGKLYMLAGNAVSVPIVKLIAEQLMKNDNDS